MPEASAWTICQEMPIFGRRFVMDLDSTREHKLSSAHLIVTRSTPPRLSRPLWSDSVIFLTQERKAALLHRLWNDSLTSPAPAGARAAGRPAEQSALLLCARKLFAQLLVSRISHLASLISHLHANNTDGHELCTEGEGSRIPRSSQWRTRIDHHLRSLEVPSPSHCRCKSWTWLRYIHPDPA